MRVFYFSLVIAFVAASCTDLVVNVRKIEKILYSDEKFQYPSNQDHFLLVENLLKFAPPEDPLQEHIVDDLMEKIVFEGHVEVLQALVAAGFNLPHLDDLVFNNRFAETILFCIPQTAADPSNLISTARSYMVKECFRPEDLEILFENGIDVQWHDSCHNGCLHAALLQNRYDLAMVAYNRGARLRKINLAFKPFQIFYGMGKFRDSLEMFGIMVSKEVIQSQIVTLLCGHPGSLLEMIPRDVVSEHICDFIIKICISEDSLKSKLFR